jgi:branched-chain amino acid aminotransferase
VIGLREIDYRTIDGGKTGPITREFQKVYHDLIRGKVEKYEHWCEYVSDVNVKSDIKVNAEIEV